ncbi:MAG: GPO family capsid scaffolding protein [Alphaproteobacteria bacterium]|nr:MAG: GPO family capsid scaffolding protein [Alphaproteobacteria bacterium]
MAKRSKFFRLAVEGATCDGRTIDRKLIQEMAETYDPATYQARVNIEHLRGISPEPPFNAQGDVVAVEAREINLNIAGKTEKRLALYGQVDALDNLVSTNAKGQKLFPSIEINPSFADSGKAYLQGLAVTDSPASLGTEILTFAAAQGEKNPFASRKIDKGNFFSAVDEAIDFGFEEASAEEKTGFAAAVAAATEFFSQFKPAAPAPATPPVVAPGGETGDFAALQASIGQGFEKLNAAMGAGHAELKASLTKLRSDHDALATTVETTDGGTSRRPPATGGKNFALTDC